MTRPVHAVRCIIVAVAFAASIARAQSVRAELSPDRTVAGAAVTLSVVVEGTSSTEAPTLPPIDGAAAAFAGQSSYLVNGRGSITFKYTLTPQREGVIRVPPIDVTARGRTLRTEPLLLRVTPPETSDATRLDLIVSNDEPYVGEPFTIRFRWAFPRRIMRVARRIGPVELPDTIRVLQAIDPRPVGAQRSNRNFERIETLFDTPLYATTDVVTRAREQFVVLEATVLVAATAPGEISLGPGVVLYDEIIASSRLRTNAEIRQARSEPVVINARALPTEGVPPGFYGLVGRVELESAIDRDDIGVGDPITLRLRVTGDEPLSRFDPPALAEFEAFGPFRTDAEGWSVEESRTGERVYETVIRASHDEIDAVPAIEAPYFDTELGEYRVASSDPIPISVRTRRRVTAADAEVAPRAEAPTSTFGATPLERSSVGPPATPLTEALLVDRSFTLAGAMREPATIAVLAGGPACVLAAGALAARRARRDPREHRRRHALKRARRALGSSLESHAEAVRGFVADHAGVPADSVTAEDVRSLSCDADTQGVLRRALQSHDAARFGRSAPHNPTASEIRSALRRAHAQALHGDES